MSLTVNGLPVASMRWLAGWRGPWSAELELMSEVVPSGPVAIVNSQGDALSGTVDPDHSGSFGEKHNARVVGGRGGWSKTVPPQQYHGDLGVRLDEVVATTAAAVGELATLLMTKPLGIDFVRLEGPASQIFDDAGVDWWVGLDGVTRVGVRLPVVAPTSLVILDWDAATGTASFACDVLVEPGTVVIDTRFGQRVVREVEAKISAGSVTGNLWLVDAPPAPGAASELVAGLGELAARATRAKFARLYEYVVIDMQGDRVELVPLSLGAPPLEHTSIWAGASGYKATLRPGAQVLVGFREGDRTKPYVAAYEPPEGGGWRPVKLELDALASLVLGEQALDVVLGLDASALPVARAPAILAFAQALQTALAAAAASATASAAAPVTGTTLGGWLGTLATAVGAAASTLGTACPSAKVRSS